MFRRDRRVLVTAGVALLQVIVLMIAVVAVMTGYRDGRARSPQAAVESYLRALADGDADSARRLMETPPDYRLLSETALRQARRIAAIGDIEVAEVPNASGTAEVAATYRIGDVAAEAVYRTVERGDHWLVAEGAAIVDVAGLSVPGLTVFDRPVGEVAVDDRIFVFPGPIVWGSTERYLTVVAADYPRVPGPFGPPELTAVLDEDGRETATAAVDRQLSGCAESQQPVAARDRPGCRQVLFARAEDNSVRWVKPDDLSDLEFAVDQADPDRVRVNGRVVWEVRYRPAEGSLTTDEYVGYLRGTVDLAADPPVYQP